MATPTMVDLKMDFFESASSDSSDSSDDDTKGTRLINCPETGCGYAAFEHQLIDHLKQRHKLWLIQMQGNYFRIRVCYRRRFNGSAGFSDAETANNWVAGILCFDKELFLLNIKEQNGLMHIWVSIDDVSNTKNAYVVNIALALPNGQLPGWSIRKLWRGIVVSVFNLDNCAKLIVPNNIMWRDFTFQGTPRVAPPSSHTLSLPSQQQVPQTNYHWNMRIILEKAPGLRPELEIKGGGEMILDRHSREAGIWFNAKSPISSTRQEPRSSATKCPLSAIKAEPEFKILDISKTPPQQGETGTDSSGTLNALATIDWVEHARNSFELIDKDGIPKNCVLTGIQNEILRKLKNLDTLSNEELREVEDALFLLQLKDRKNSTRLS